MEYEDRLTIHTPEGLDLSLALAGVGSRCAGALVDLAIQITLVGAVVLVVGPLSGALGSDYLAAAVTTVASFLVFSGYDVAWEVWGAGRTPGKRLTQLRVVRSSGAPIGFRSSAVRNLLRLVDILPGLYLLGFISVLITPRNQRLGDLAADAVVVHDRRVRPSPGRPAVVRGQAPPPEAAWWDVSAISIEDLATVRSFLDRRDQLTREARLALATQLAAGLRPKVAGAETVGDDERFLSTLAAVKAARA